MMEKTREKMTSISTQHTSDSKKETENGKDGTHRVVMIMM